MPNNPLPNLYTDPNQEEDLKKLSSRTEELLARLDELSNNLNSNLHNRPKAQFVYDQNNNQANTLFNSQVNSQINSQTQSKYNSLPNSISSPQTYAKPNYEAQPPYQNNYPNNYQNPEGHLPVPIDRNSSVNSRNDLFIQPIEIPSSQLVKPTYQYSIPINTHYIEKSEKSIQTSTNGGFMSKQTSVFTEKHHFGSTDPLSNQQPLPNQLHNQLSNQILNSEPNHITLSNQAPTNQFTANETQTNNILNSNLADYLIQKPLDSNAQYNDLIDTQSIKNQPLTDSIHNQNNFHNRQTEPIKSFPKHDLSFMDSLKSSSKSSEAHAYSNKFKTNYNSPEEENYLTHQIAQSNIQANSQSRFNQNINLNSPDYRNSYLSEDNHYELNQRDRTAYKNHVNQASYKAEDYESPQYTQENSNYAKPYQSQYQRPNQLDPRYENQYQQVVMDYPPIRPRNDERNNQRGHYIESNSEISLQPSSAFSFEPGQTRRASAKRGLNPGSNNQNSNQNFFGFGRPERAYLDNREDLFDAPNQFSSQSLGKTPSSNREFRNSMAKYAGQNFTQLNKDKEVFRWFAVAAPIFALAIPCATINFFSLSWVATLAICSIALFFGLFISIIAWRLVEISELVRWEHGQIMMIQSILDERIK